MGFNLGLVPRVNFVFVFDRYASSCNRSTVIIGVSQGSTEGMLI